MNRQAAHGNRSSENAVQAFYRAFNNGYIETIVTLYEPRARLVAQPEQLAEGHTAIREALRAFFAMKPASTLQKH